MAYWQNPDRHLFKRTFGDFDATIDLDDSNLWCASIQIAGWETPAIIGRYSTCDEAQHAINSHFRKLNIEGDATCDCCGERIEPEDIPAHLWLVIHGPETWSDPHKDTVRFEWSQEGVYCASCQDCLFDGIEQALSIPDRYNRQSSPEQIINEIKIIKSVRGG